MPDNKLRTLPRDIARLFARKENLPDWTRIHEASVHAKMPRLMLDWTEENPWYVTQGTSFPPYPGLWEQCFRTDIRGGMMFRWNGVYWLSEQLFDFAAGAENMSASGSFSSGGINGVWGGLDRDMDVFVVSAVADGLVQTTNDGSNYWTVQLLSGTVNNSWPSIATIGSTQSLALNRWHICGANYALNLLVDTTGTADANIHALGFGATKVGSPGAFYPKTLVRYRLRAT